MEPLIIICFWVIFIIGFIFIFPKISLSMSRWLALANKYGIEDTKSIDGHRHSFQRLLVNNFQYNGCFRIIDNSSGLFLIPTFPFSISHKPVFIPIADIVYLDEKKWRMDLVTINGVDNCILGIPEKIGQQLRDHYSGSESP